MKLFLILVSSLFITACLKAQEKADRNALYQFIQPTKLEQCDQLGIVIANKAQIFPTGLDFQIVSILTSGELVISIANYSASHGISKDEAERLNTLYRGTPDENKVEAYYLLPSTTFTTATEREQSKASFSFGTASTLLKYRPGSSRMLQNKYPINSDIGNDFSLAALVGIQLSVNNLINEYFLFGVNYSSIKMTSQTTQGVLTSDTNVGALTPTIAYVFEYNKVQIGLFSGLDMPTGDAGKTWVYKGRPWFGLGVGFSIFKGGASTKDGQQKN